MGALQSLFSDSELNGPSFHKNQFEQRSVGEYEILNGEAFDLLKSFDNERFELIVTSPPYNIGKSYETRVSLDDYMVSQSRVIKELVRVLATNGSICWQVGNYISKGEVYPLDYFFYEVFKENGLFLRNRIIWHFGHGLHSKKRFSGRYETILWFTKSDDYIFNLDDVRIPSKYPGKKHYKGAKKGQYSGNPLGKNPSDIWQIISDDWEKGVWNIPNVKANHPEKSEHPCQFPVELVERCVLALSNENDWVLDPFAGVGSSMIAALKNGRNSIGIDKESTYCQIIKERVQKLENGNLRTRPINKPIHSPGPNEKTALKPVGWDK